jgi:hypothetical protein
LRSRSVSFDTWSDVQCSDWCTVFTLMPRAESGAENSLANAAITRCAALSSPMSARIFSGWIPTTS